MANNSTANLTLRDLQALTPDMVLNEPEYWNRYELEVGEEGEGGTMGYEKSTRGFRNLCWPHLEAYITPQVSNNEFSSPRQVELETRQEHPMAAGEETEAGDTGLPEETSSPMYDVGTSVNDLLREWNTQSTIGDVLRDFHFIIAYVLEGMQQYEAGLAPWPCVPQVFDRRMRSLNVEEVEGNISIVSASRRVLSLLEGTSITQTSCPEETTQNLPPRVSKIPRFVKKDLKIGTLPPTEGCPVPSGDGVTHAQPNTNQQCKSQVTESDEPITSIFGAGKLGITIPGPPDVLAKDTHHSRTLSYSVLDDSDRTSTSRSPNKRGTRTTDLGHIGSKIPILLVRSGSSNTPNVKTESVGRTPVAKGVENSPIRGRRGRLMAGEMQAPTELHFSRGRKLTRDSSLLVEQEFVNLGQTKSGPGKHEDDEFGSIKENRPLGD